MAMSIWKTSFGRLAVTQVVQVPFFQARYVPQRTVYKLMKAPVAFAQTTSSIPSSSPSAAASTATTTQTVAQAVDQAPPLPFSAIPGPRGVAQWPVVGPLMLFKPFTKFTPATAHEMVDNLFEQYGPLVRCQMSGTTVLVRDVKDVETVFRNEGIYPLRSTLQLFIQFARRNNLKDGLSEVQGEAWHKLRSPLTKRLARVNSASYYMHQQNAVADEFVAILKSGGHMTPEDLSDTFFRYTAESIGVVCFNTRLGFLDPNSSTKPDTLAHLQASKAIFYLLQDEVKGRSLLHNVYRNKTYREFEAFMKTLRSSSRREIEKAMAILKQRQEDGTFDPEEPNLLFSLLSDPSLDFDDIHNLMNTLYVGGTDSTAKNLQVFFYNMASHPEKQELLYKEIIDVLGPDKPLTPEALAVMPYLKAAIKESFRITSPAIGISRFMPRDIVLSGYNVPAGTHIMICNHSVSKEYFDNTEEFLPERWLRSEEGRQLNSNIHPLAVLPFSYGPRNCIGRRFAEQEMHLAVVKVLQKLRVGVKRESEKMRFTYSLFVEPEKPIAFTFAKR